MTDEQVAIAAKFDEFARTIGATARTHNVLDIRTGFVVCRYILSPATEKESSVYCTFVQTSDKEYLLFITSTAVEPFKLSDTLIKRHASDMIMRHTQKVLRVIGREVPADVVFESVDDTSHLPEVPDEVPRSVSTFPESS